MYIVQTVATEYSAANYCLVQKVPLFLPSGVLIGRKSAGICHGQGVRWLLCEFVHIFGDECHQFLDPVSG